MFRYRSRAIAAWPNEWVLPSVSFGGAHGVFIDALRRFAPANEWRIISDQAGPTCLFVQPHAPLIFVGLNRRLLRNMNSDNAATTHVQLVWLLGFAPVCGPFPQRFH